MVGYIGITVTSPREPWVTLHVTPEQETPTKPPKKDAKSIAGSSPVEGIVSDISLITPQDFMTPQQRRRLALEKLDEEERTTAFKAFTLQSTDHATHKVKWDDIVNWRRLPCSGSCGALLLFRFGGWRL
jgi:hypothetical protein